MEQPDRFATRDEWAELSRRISRGQGPPIRCYIRWQPLRRYSARITSVIGSFKSREGGLRGVCHEKNFHRCGGRCRHRSLVHRLESGPRAWRRARRRPSRPRPKPRRSRRSEFGRRRASWLRGPARSRSPARLLGPPGLLAHRGFHRGGRGTVFLGVAPLVVGPAYAYCYDPGYVHSPPEYSAPPPTYYYCPSAGAYYPDVPSCPEPWVPVPAQ